MISETQKSLKKCLDHSHAGFIQLFNLIQERNDDLFSKQGSLSASKIILIKMTQKYFLNIYLHIFIFFIK